MSSAVAIPSSALVLGWLRPASAPEQPEFGPIAKDLRALIRDLDAGRSDWFVRQWALLAHEFYTDTSAAENILEILHGFIVLFTP